MNKGFQLITLLFLLLCGHDSAWAQLDTIPPIDHQLVTAEYFWDTDPGVGNGTALLATDGNIDEVVENLLNSGLNVPAPLGAHLFNVRIKNFDGDWSPVFRTLVNTYNPTATDSLPTIKVAQAEYFWDTDPGEGAGNPLLAFDGAFDEAVEALFKNGLSVPGATVPHTFNIRIKSEHDGWGTLFRTIVHPYTPSVSDSFPTIKIALAEYFWDTDPGEGSGSAMLAFDGAFDEAVEAVFQNGLMVPVTEGPHTFNVRYQSEHDGWGIVFSTLVHSYSPSVSDSLPAIKLTHAEYFWDTDPGQGNGSPMLAFDGALDEAVESVFSNGLTPPNPIGPNEFNVRFKNEEGDWGSLFRTIVHSYLPAVTDSFPAINIQQAEYFWDNDPGEGNGTPLLALDGNIDEVVETLLKNDIEHPMPCGAHRFNVRAKSLEGDWGMPFSSIVYVEDTLPPVPVCQNITVQLDAVGQISLDSNAIDGGSTDNCQIVAFELDSTQYDCSDIGDHPVMMTITDFAGFMDSCSSIVTIQDTIAPTALCQNITIQLDASGNQSITATQIDNGSTDVCGITSIALDTTDFNCNDVEQNIVTLTATDNNGNTAACTAMVSVFDTIQPIAICMGLTVQLDGSGTASITPADVDNGSNDACGINLSLDTTSFVCGDVGLNTVTLTVTDDNSNIASCTSQVTVSDTVSPVAICMDLTIQLDASGNVAVAPIAADNGSNDACGIESLSLSQSSFACGDVGANSETLTVTDVNGNTSSCSTQLTVQDTISPTASCQDVTAQLDASGDASISASQVDNGSTDACGVLNTVIDITDFDCDSVGSVLVTLTVTDNNSNTSSCTASVLVADTVSPIALCNDLTIQLDGLGNGAITPASVNNNSTDACGIASLALNNSTFECADTGIQQVTLTATDNNGNSQTCTAQITVEDPFSHVNYSTVSICDGDSIFAQGSWQTSSGVYFDTISSAFSPCDSVLVTELTVLPNQDITINTGWNMISSFMTSNYPSMEMIFGDIEQNIVIVKDGAGNPYLPSIPLNMIGDWDLTKGYKVKALTGTTLTIGCDQADPAATPIHLPGGWSIVSYVREDAMDAATALASLGDTLIMAKDNNGAMFVPDFMNDIGDLLPGQGYLVKLTEPATLLYPANTARYSGVSTYSGNAQAAHYTLDRNTGNNSSIIIPNGSIEGLEPGDEIGVFNIHGSLTGSAVYEDNHLGIAVWGMDPLDGGLENMANEEPYKYRLWRPATGEEHPMYVEYEEGLPYYTSNGISYIRSGIVEGLVTVVEETHELNTQIFVYPNPANQKIKVEIWLKESSQVNITIHDLSGKEVLLPRLESLAEGEHLLELDISNLASGNYIYRVNTDEQQFNGSIIKMK
ncbi:MAG: T9SS type A sorting domain-containing protein [Bacteroidetes bacterium]|nr:T9SS type A sorting domain-containing protein [Bacteroidota bacterium]